MKIVIAALTASVVNMVKNVFINAKVPNVDFAHTNNVEDTVAALGEQTVVFIDWEYPDETLPVNIVTAVKERSKQVPVLLLSTKQKAGGTFAAMKAGATGVVNKPIVPEELLRAVASAFKASAPEKRASVNVEFINPFIDASRNVFSTMCGVEITRKKLFLKEDHKMLGEVSGVMGLSGTASGSVVVSLSKKLACTLVSKMLGEPESQELTADVCDGVGEIINMIAGQAKSMLTKTKYHFNISIPSVVSGVGHEITHKKGTPNIVVLFEAMGEDFALQVCLVSSESE